MVKPLEHVFPGLAKGGYQVTSPPSNSYNCIAYAAGDTAKWWWPADVKEAFWPEGVTRAETLPALTAAFASLGYRKIGPKPGASLTLGAEVSRSPGPTR
jgi:hypothetical protein